MKNSYQLKWCYSLNSTLLTNFFMLSNFCGIAHYLKNYGLTGVNYCTFREQPDGALNKMKKTWSAQLFWRKFKTIHGFTISVPVLILPIFLQLLLRTEKFRVKFCFETNEHSVQTADNNSKVTSEAPQVTSYYVLSISCCISTQVLSGTKSSIT